MKRKLLKSFVLILLLFSVGCSGAPEENSSNSLTMNPQTDNEQDHSMDYICEVNFNPDDMTCSNYVMLEDDGIKSNTPNIYIPNAGTYYHEGKYTPTAITTKTIIEIDMLSGVTFITEYSDDLVSQGTYYMTGTSQDDVLVKHYTQNILDEESEIVEMIRLNRTFECSDGSTLASPPYNYTVSVQAGIYEDCVCMTRERTDEYGTNYTVSYYAPLVGKVLELHYDEFLNKEYGIEWYLFEELVNISTENSNFEDNLSNNITPDSLSNDDYNIWEDGQRYEYYVQGAAHFVHITSPDYYSEIFLQIDDGETICLPVWGIAENRYFSYSTDDGSYYLERDAESAEIYLRCNDYEGYCTLRPYE